MNRRTKLLIACGMLAVMATVFAGLCVMFIGMNRSGFDRDIALVDRGAEAVVAPESQNEVLAIHALLEQQNVAWNRADIDGFMVAYWNSPELSFSSGGGTTRGWQATRERYRTRYPDPATMGVLNFNELETRLLAPDAAFTLGRWKLERSQPIEGNFTLVWQKFDGVWRIVHDHSSSTPTPPVSPSPAPNQP